MIRFLASIASFAIMLGLGALLLTPDGLIALRFILAGLLALWIIQRVWRRVQLPIKTGVLARPFASLHLAAIRRRAGHIDCRQHQGQGVRAAHLGPLLGRRALILRAFSRHGALPVDFPENEFQRRRPREGQPSARRRSMAARTVTLFPRLSILNGWRLSGARMTKSPVRVTGSSPGRTSSLAA
jgi:hypothetical protein